MKKIDPRTFNRRQKIALVGAAAVLVVLTGVIMWQTRTEPEEAAAPYELSSFVVDDENGQIQEISTEEYEKYIQDADTTFVVLAHNTACPIGMPLTSTVKDLAHKYHLRVLGLMQEEFQDSSLSKVIRFLPSLAVIRDGKVVAYLDAESDADLPAYKSVKGLEDWLKQYVKL